MAWLTGVLNVGSHSLESGTCIFTSKAIHFHANQNIGLKLKAKLFKPTSPKFQPKARLNKAFYNFECSNKLTPKSSTVEAVMRYAGDSGPSLIQTYSDILKSKISFSTYPKDFDPHLPLAERSKFQICIHHRSSVARPKLEGFCAFLICLFGCPLQTRARQHADCYPEPYYGAECANSRGWPSANFRTSPRSRKSGYTSE